MSYLRISLMQPRDKHLPEVKRLQEDLLHYFKTLPGFIDGYLMATEDGTSRMGRVTVWESAGNASQAAQDHHVLAVRSQMTLLLDDEPDNRLEQGFEVTKA